MARLLFDGGEQVVDSEGNARTNFGFTVWTQYNGGTNVTNDMRTPDGLTQATVQTDADGEIPYLRGPDGVQVLYRDMGTGTRSPWYSSEALADLLGASLVQQMQALVDRVAFLEATGGGGGGGGVSDHGALTGLADDDHPQYHNNTRGDARYYTKAQSDATNTSVTTTLVDHTQQLANKAPLTHNHTASQITGGAFDVGRLPAGVSLKVIWDDPANQWRLNGSVITGRPGGRTDILLDFIGGLETDRPAWGNQPGDTHEVTQTP